MRVRSPRAAENPMLARSLAIAMLFLPCAAHAQERWTEPRVLALVAVGSPTVLAARVHSARARARGEGVGLYPNPSVDWERQESFEPNAQTQDVVRATVPVDLSGRRDAERLLAELDAESSAAETARARLEASAAALALFYRALALERRVSALREAQAGLDGAGRIVASRARAGEASGYEHARLALEIELARSRLTESEAERAMAIGVLGALVGSDAGADALEGDFDVAMPERLDTLLARAEERRPEIASLAVRRALASRARGAAELAWIPRAEIFGGYNLQVGPQVGHGYAIGLRLELPLFDRGQGHATEADAALAALEAQARAARAAVRAEVGAAHARLVAALAERARFSAVSGDALALVLRAVEAGYAGGERTLLELLDARRAALEVAMQQLALDVAVRLADVELRRSGGEL